MGLDTTWKLKGERGDQWKRQTETGVTELQSGECCIKVGSENGHHWAAALPSLWADTSLGLRAAAIGHGSGYCQATGLH